MRGQKEPVPDLPIGKATAGQGHNLALLRGELRQRVGFGRRGGDSARSQFCLCALRRRVGAQPPERFQGGDEEGFRLVNAALPPEPLGVVEAELSPFERPLVPGRIGQGLSEVGFGLGPVVREAMGTGNTSTLPTPRT